MAKINQWVTSDWHFNHANIIKYCNRPFKTAEEMNEAIIREHNKKVQPHDIVYVLGDVGQGDLDKIIPRLNGTKILIKGNHDKASDTAYLRAGFAAVLFQADIWVGKTLVHMRHVPTKSFWGWLKLCRVYWKQGTRRKHPFRVKWQRIKREWRQASRLKGRPVLCGHVHQAWKTKGENINVGVDVHDMKPVKLHDMVNKYLASQKKA